MSAPKLNLPLNSRVFSVTGGASGMGAATVRLLAEQGAGAIWIADRNGAAFASIKREVSEINPPAQVFTTELDVAGPKQVEDWVAEIVTTSGGVLHGAANVVGVSQPVFTREKPAILAETDEDWAHILGVNLQGIMYCTRAQVRAMVKMPPGSNPAIVNVGSLASLRRGPRAFAYGASKAACAHFTACVAKDVYPFGIRVNTASPGNTFTPMTKEFCNAKNDAVIALVAITFFGTMSKEETEQQLERAGISTKMLDPSDVARNIVWLLSEASIGVNGVNLAVGEGAM